MVHADGLSCGIAGHALIEQRADLPRLFGAPFGVEAADGVIGAMPSISASGRIRTLEVCRPIPLYPMPS